MRFITIDEVYAIHQKVIEFSGGKEEINDFNLLHSSIERPKATFGGKFLYPTVWLQAGALMHSLIKNHPFSDANKRTALTSAVYFLYKNGYEIELNVVTAVKFCTDIVIKNLTVAEIASWFKAKSNK